MYPMRKQHGDASRRTRKRVYCGLFGARQPADRYREGTDTANEAVDRVSPTG